MVEIKGSYVSDLLKGKRPISVVQRIGITVSAIAALLWGLIMIAGIAGWMFVPEFNSLKWLVILVVMPIQCVLGLYVSYAGFRLLSAANRRTRIPAHEQGPD